MSSVSPQLPLALRYPPDQRFETFVGAPDGALDLLRALVTAAPAHGRFAGVYIAGPAGTGKSHLAMAICAMAEAQARRAIYLPLVAAVGRMPDALQAIHDADVVALDGIEAIAGDRDAEIALFDFHNRAHDAGKAVCYTARDWPDALPLVLPDLRSRLNQCTRVALQVLDDAGRGDVLRLRAQRRGLQIDAAAIDWLLRRVDRDLASLTALLDRLDRASLAEQRRITVPFLRQLLEQRDADAASSLR
jgi:DnaA family protein